MYSDKNPLYPAHARRDIPPRALSGRSRPTFANPVSAVNTIPNIMDQQGKRLCDGTLPETQTAPRNDHGADNCGEGGGWGLSSYPLASVYSPLQEFRDLYDEEKALERGTLFAELDLPFEGAKGGCRSC